MAALGDIRRLTWRIFLLQLLTVIWVTPPSVYMMSMLMDLSSDQVIWLIKYTNPYTNILFGALLPFWIVRAVLKRGLTVNPNEPTEVVLARLLKIPRAIDIGIQLNYVVGTTQYVAVAAWKFNTNWITVPWAATMVTLLTMLAMIWTRIRIIRLLSPIVRQEFLKNPRVVLKETGLLWPRQSWYLPYVFAVFVLCSMFMTLTAIVGKSKDVLASLVQKLQDNQGVDVSTTIYTTVLDFARHSAGILLLLAVYLLVSAAIAALALARYETEGAQAMQQSIESLASGQPRLPQWVSTDELGDLAFATARAFDKLRTFSLSLLDSARQLGQSAEQLNTSTSEQNAVLSRQAAALQETQVTAQEIRTTSMLTSQKAEGILQKVDQADSISRSGEVALERSMASLRDIRESVSQITERIKALDERARQIGNITRTVKDLADQSNMLALNAAIEAVRSGEAGKGFGVVAREIRALADQSIGATNNVRQILQDISSAIRLAVENSEQGSQKIESSLIEINAFGDNIRALSAIVRDNASSVRQISAAVNQQDAGITQIFQAVSDLSKMMDETLGRLKLTSDATNLVQDVARRVFEAVSSNDWQQRTRETQAPADATGKSGGV